MISTPTGFLSEEGEKVTKAGPSGRQKYVTFYIVTIYRTIKYAGGAERKHLHYIGKHVDITQSPARVWVYTAGREDVRGSGGEDPLITRRR
jgi:hypothetical protein